MSCTSIKIVAGIKIVDRDQPNILVALIVPAYCVKKQNKCTYIIYLHFFRLCSLTLTRLVLHKALGADLNSVIIAVKMQVS